MKFKCDLCEERMEWGELELVWDRFRGSYGMYCRECVSDYKAASSNAGQDIAEFLKLFNQQRA